MNAVDRAHVRDFHQEDLEGIIRLWEDAHSTGDTPAYSMAEVIASCSQDYAVVAIRDDQVVGAAVGRAAHAQGWVVFFRLSDEPERVGVELLDELERKMSPLGLAKLSILVSSDGPRLDLLVRNGFEPRRSLRYLERNLWDTVAGMHDEKRLLEERLVTPLAQPGLAERFGVVPPRAVMLFGPPGTGKTTFAKAVASRLDWPFVEVSPARLADSAAGLAGALRQTFDSIGQLEHAVVFIDEVEEIAATRRGDPPSATQGVTNELLKLVAEFRDREGRLLVCATNFVRSLDAAFLRHGRFDYVVPIGLPDPAARSAIWQRYIPPHVVGDVDLETLVRSSEGLTPADIEYAARRASQDALARALERGDTAEDDSRLPGTKQYLRALNATRATVSEDDAREFLEDIATIARL